MIIKLFTVALIVLALSLKILKQINVPYRRAFITANIRNDKFI